MLKPLAPAYKVIVGNVHKVGITPFSTDPVFVGTFPDCQKYIQHGQGLSIMRLRTASYHTTSRKHSEARQPTERTV